MFLLIRPAADGQNSAVALKKQQTQHRRHHTVFVYDVHLPGEDERNF